MDRPGVRSAGSAGRLLGGGVRLRRASRRGWFGSLPFVDCVVVGTLRDRLWIPAPRDDHHGVADELHGGPFGRVRPGSDRLDSLCRRLRRPLRRRDRGAGGSSRRHTGPAELGFGQAEERRGVPGGDGERALVRGDRLTHGAHLVHDPTRPHGRKHPAAGIINRIRRQPRPVQPRPEQPRPEPGALAFDVHRAAVSLERRAMPVEGVVGGAQRLPRGTRVGHRA